MPNTCVPGPVLLTHEQSWKDLRFLLDSTTANVHDTHELYVRLDATYKLVRSDWGLLAVTASYCRHDSRGHTSLGHSLLGYSWIPKEDAVDVQPLLQVILDKMQRVSSQEVFAGDAVAQIFGDNAKGIRKACAQVSHS